MTKKKHNYEKPIIEIIEFEESEIETSGSTLEVDVGDWWND